ncbi:ATPase, AAA family protein [Tritrichomonas foetus]|uniref:ATPase, AAA family protein n=1 Tax=Tritrichomonas foetus TaxID=1144522 RepID=A0A1J4K0H0_9EUKA|nr:ATPase, AAA family protein [Tritrichomonas foetus]|eukprot:OHT03268.1 ATPase, AAA family protein [Tritrichomonas foetus]
MFGEKRQPNPIIEQVNLAREHAKLESYDVALRTYDSAKQEINTMIESCKDSSYLPKWNGLIKDIGAEEAAIIRIKTTLDDIFEILDNDDTPDLPQPFEDMDNSLAPPQWSHNDDIIDLPRNRKMRGRDRRPNIDGIHPKKNGPSRQPPGFSVSHIKVVPKQIEFEKPKRAAPASKNSKRERPPPPQKVDATKKDEKAAKSNLDDPLVNQIIDMGILIREPNVQWDQIAGLAQVKRLLRQNLVILPMRPDICKGLLAPWKSVLFYGPPGTGKTFLAKAVATECRRTFFNVTSATITSKFHGESEKLVSHLFDLAEQMAPSTIFFDEIDSVASQRGSGHENEASRRMKSQLLTKLEGIDGACDNSTVFVLAATNFPWDLDEALLRRFQKRIYIPLPDIEGRLAILKMNLVDLINEDEFDIQKWAEKLDGYSCADITNLCRDAAQAVFERQLEEIDPDEWANMNADDAKVEIKDADFEKAVSLRKSSVDAASLKKYDEWRLSKGAE